MDNRRLTEISSRGVLQVLHRTPSQIEYMDGKQTFIVEGFEPEEKYNFVVQKCYEIEECEEFTHIKTEILLKALLKGFYFWPPKDEDGSIEEIIRKKALNDTPMRRLKPICFSKFTTGLEENNPFFKNIGYDNKPLPLFKVSLSLDEMAITIYVWSPS